MPLSQRLVTHQLGIIFISLMAVTLVLYPAGLGPGPGLNRAQKLLWKEHHIGKKGGLEWTQGRQTPAKSNSENL